jgi:hypothetical protein
LFLLITISQKISLKPWVIVFSLIMFSVVNPLKKKFKFCFSWHYCHLFLFLVNRFIFNKETFLLMFCKRLKNSNERNSNRKSNSENFFRIENQLGLQLDYPTSLLVLHREKLCLLIGLLKIFNSIKYRFCEQWQIKLLEYNWGILPKI